MTLKEVVRTIEVVASQQPSVNMIVENDVFRLNNKADARYGVFAWLQNQHSTSLDSSLMQYSFTFFYVDRLTADRGNQIEVQSIGIETLDNIVRYLDELGIYVESSYSFTTFNQRFLDDCAGVYCNVVLSVPVGTLCPEAFADFSLDFSDDFLIY